MATALFVSFDVAHVETLTIVEKRSCFCQLYLENRCTLCTPSNSVVLQPWKLLKPFFSKATAQHLPLFFVFASWRRLLRICSSCLIFGVFSASVSFLVNCITLLGVSFVNTTSALKTKTKDTVLFTSPHVKGEMASTVDCIIYFVPRIPRSVTDDSKMAEIEKRETKTFTKEAHL